MLNEVEALVTFPIESAMMGIPGTLQVRSISKFGLSLITIVFADEVDTYFARQLVNERLQEAKTRIPEGVESTLGPVATAFGEIYQYVIEGEGYTAMELKTLHDWNIKFQLRTIAGVNEVNSWGGFTQQFHVLVDPERLLAYQLSLRDVFDALADSNANFGGSYIERGAEAFTVRGLGLFRDIEDIENVVVKSGSGVSVLVRDLAEVEIGPAVRQGAVTKDAEGEVVSGMVIMTKGENSKEVIERINQRVGEVVRSLPPGVTLSPYYDQTELVNRTTRTVATNLIEGALLVVVILFFFLHDFRAALIVASVIPLSMLIAFVGMRYFGVSANLMSLGAIDFGLIVDGSVVLIENVVRRLSQPLSGADGEATSSKAIVQDASLEVVRPIVFGVSIIIAVYTPIFALEGMSARMFYPMAFTVVTAIAASLVLALTYVPAVASLICRRKAGPHSEPLLAALRVSYRNQLAKALQRRGLTLGIAAVLVLVALGSVPYLGTEFMPELDEGAILIETRRLPSVSLTQPVVIATRIEEVVKEFPEVKTVVTKIGRPDLATEAMGIYQGDVCVLLKPQGEWETADTKEELINAMDERLQQIPGVAFNFTQPLAMRLDEVISGVRSDVAVKLFGEEFDELQRQAERIRPVLARTRGSADVQIEVLSGAAELRIGLNRVEMVRYGLRVMDVGDFIETAVGGKTATQVLDGRRRFDVVARLPEERRKDPITIRSLLVPTPGGERVPLGQLAHVEIVEGPEVINREDSQRRIVIQSNVRGRDIGSFVAEAQAAIEREVALPPGYYIAWGGEFEKQQEAMARLYLVVPLAILLIFLLLFTNFNSLLQSLLIMVNLPLSMVGGIGVLWLRGLNLNFSASIGFIALFGVAVLNYSGSSSGSIGAESDSGSRLTTVLNPETFHLLILPETLQIIRKLSVVFDG